MAGLPRSGAGQTPPQATPPQSSPAKDMMTATQFCMIGQESVHELVTKATDIFALYRQLQSPQALSEQQQKQARAQIQEILKVSSSLLQRCRIIYMRVREEVEKRHGPATADLLEYTDSPPVADVIATNPEKVLSLSEQHRAARDVLQRRTRQLGEVMVAVRTAVWQINAALASLP